MENSKVTNRFTRITRVWEICNIWNIYNDGQNHHWKIKLN